MSRRLLLAVAIAVALAGAPQATAVTCGTLDPATGLPARAALTLDEKTAVTARTFRRSTQAKTLSLIFTTSGCDLVALEPPPRRVLLPQRGLDELPEDAVTIVRAEVEGSSFELILAVHPDRFDPGSYGNLVSVRAPYLALNRTPVTVSRSEAAEWKPLGIGALAALASFVWFAALKFVSRAKLEVSWRWLILVAVLAVGAGLWGVINSYWDQDVWTVDANWRATAVAGFTGASTGAIAAVLTTIWRAPPKK